MTIGPIRASTLVVTLSLLCAMVTPADAELAKTQIACQKAISKGALGYFKGSLKLLQKCRNAGLKDGSCTTPDVGAVAKLDTKLADTITKSCTLPISNYDVLGFPGPCPDPNPGDDFTLADLQACIRDSHAGIIDDMMALQYDASLVSTIPSADLKCQAEVAKQGAALAVCILKNVQKCRDALIKGKPLGVPPDFCATNHVKTRAAIEKCEDKLTAGIAGKCSSAQVASLKICTPDTIDAPSAASCLIAAETVRTDGPEIIVPPDLIDYEYAVRSGLCGDGVINNLNEECDTDDDDSCTGECGTALDPDGHFACLCKTKPRMVIVEHTNADTDNGWTGRSSDGAVVEGGNYLVDLYDCDMSGLCIVGPNCSLPPHSPCSPSRESASGTTADSICAGLGQGTCRKERTANGPHCYQDINKKCNPKLPADPVCNAPGDFCQTTFHGPPVAASAGGVTVCNISIFSEDIVGTANILDGTASVKVRQNALTHQNLLGSANKPCPVCGNFCALNRERCDVDGDCAPGMGPCILEPICSDGPRQDKLCRQTAPFGGSVALFGVTSVDCPPNPNTNITGDGLDINANPRTTGTVTLAPGPSCTGAGYTANACAAGANAGTPCAAASECPGSVCTGQCFCSGQLKPNDCAAACLGGGNDAAECSVPSECPGGICHVGDCRLDPFDFDSTQEGICTSGPADGRCSITTFKSCTVDADCNQTACPFCELGETCGFTNRACFVNSGIIRTGTPRTPNGESAAVYCVPSPGASFTAINTSAGFPGPGALIQRETMMIEP